MPGWGIVADLMPPEVLDERRVHAVKQKVLLSIVFLLVLCIALFAFTFMRKQAASNALDKESARTTELRSEQAKYSDITAVQSVISSVKAQMATLLASDVNWPQVMGQLHAAMPVGMTISAVQINDTAADTKVGGSASANGGDVLDTSGHSHVATIVINGNAQSPNDVAKFVSTLSKVDGYVGLFPSSTRGTKGATQYTVSVTLTDALLTHRYDVTPGTK